MRMETIEKTLYKFEELEESAQTKALDTLRESQCDDSHWYEFVYDDAARVFDLLGIDSRKPVKLMNGETLYKPAIWFSGFCSQGDGACFEGSYSYKAGSVKAVKEYAPQDEKLHAIAERLAEVQRKHFYSLTASLSHSDRYCHEHSVTIQVEDSRDSWRDVAPDDVETVKDCLRDLMRWIYHSLESEYEHQTSDDCLKELIEANEYEFESDGSLA